jgi:hypothetical protein
MRIDRSAPLITRGGKRLDSYTDIRTRLKRKRARMAFVRDLVAHMALFVAVFLLVFVATS